MQDMRNTTVFTELLAQAGPTSMRRAGAAGIRAQPAKASADSGAATSRA